MCGTFCHWALCGVSIFKNFSSSDLVCYLNVGTSTSVHGMSTSSHWLQHSYFLFTIFCFLWTSFSIRLFNSLIHASVQFSPSVMSDSATPWTTAHQASRSITNSQSLLKLMSIKLVMPSNHLILCHPLLLPPSIFPSIRVSSNESVLHIRWPEYWSFSFSISPSNEYSGLISVRMNWLDLRAVQGTLKSLLQHHSSKARILRQSAFFIDQLSRPYMTTGKTIALTRWTFVGKVMSAF